MFSCGKRGDALMISSNREKAVETMESIVDVGDG
jgi:hypothetical protein